MKNSTLVKIVIALLFYCIAFAAILVQGEDNPLVLKVLGTELDPHGGQQQVTQLINLVTSFQTYAAIVLSVSLVCFLVWHVLTAAVIRPTARSSTWLLVWWLLLVVILVSACIVSFVAMPVLNGFTEDYKPGYVAAFYIGVSIFLYWTASVFCSPLNARYRIWPAKYLPH